ncbi:MAG: family 16 glycosylhydrolase [Rikenellaceae bacterium]
MKNLLTPLALVAVMLSSCQSTKTSPEFNLVWHEDFNGSSLDETVWSKIPRGGADWNNYMSDYDSLYEVSGGHLILRGIVNSTQSLDTAQYLTGGVFTKEKKTFGLGRMEIRAKLQSATGYWPAFWMLPAHSKWPSGGEIDIMEHLNYDSIAYQTLHTNYTYKLGIKNPAPGSTAVIDVDGYNTYAVEKYQDSICFYINDQKTLSYPRLDSVANKGQFPFCDEPYYLLLDSQLGGSWVGAVDPKTLPVEMAIDWVKFYELKQE